MNRQEHFENILRIINIDDYDEEIMYRIYHYCIYFKLIDERYPANPGTVRTTLQEIGYADQEVDMLISNA